MKQGLLNYFEGIKVCAAIRNCKGLGAIALLVLTFSSANAANITAKATGN